MEDTTCEIRDKIKYSRVKNLNILTLLDVCS